MATTIYCFDPETGEYTGVTRPAKLNSDGKEKIPPKLHASQTADVPPDTKSGYAVCRKDGKWVQVEDHRNDTVYSTATGAVVPIKKLGPLPDTVTTEPRPNEFCTWTSGQWVEDTQAKAAADAEVTRQAGIEADTAYLSLVDKAKTASSAQIKSYIDTLFPSLTSGQRDFLKALVFIAIMNPQLRG